LKFPSQVKSIKKKAVINYIALFLVLLISADIKAQSDTIETTVPALKNVYANDFYIGCLLSYPHVGFSTDPYVPGQGTVVAPNGGYLIKYHMNSMSPGNNMKPQYTVDLTASAAAYNAASTQEARDLANVNPVVRFNGNLIAQLNWAKRQGFTFRGHTLVWHSQTPGTAFFRHGYSVSGERLSKELMTQRLENYIKEVIRIIHENWPGLLSAFDVVNEAVNDNGAPRTTDSEWYTTFGDITFIMKAFEFARKYTTQYGETQIKLYYNDYNTHTSAKADGIVNLVKPVYEAGYLDGIGMQEHDGNDYPTAEQWIATYNKFYPVCDEMAVTEMDVKNGSASPGSALLQTQANQYGQLFKCFVERSYFSGRGKLISVSKDGLNDQYTFVTNSSSSLWTSQNKCKPAFFAVAEVGQSYNALDSLIKFCSTLNESEYTGASWAVLSDALSNADIIMYKNYSRYVSAADSLDNAETVLNNAIAGLKKPGESYSGEPVIVEAESGTVGSEFSVMTEGGTSYISVQTDLVNSGNPGNVNRIAAYEITFPDTGTYNLFIRIRVGASTYNDDSFFYGSGFGNKTIDNDDDWVISNGLAAAGFSDTGNVVDEPGGLGSGIWKWVNLSRNAYQGETSITFTIEPGNLTQTFMIGGRENGLDIDKIAFGKSYLYYTVGNLDNGEPGLTELPGDIYNGPPLASKQPKFVGSAYSVSQAPNFISYWNQVTPENAGKWGSVEGTRDVMNWGSLDEAYNLARENGFPFTFHVLIWGSQQPSWISNLVSNPAEQLEEIREWFQAVADRYPDIDYLQVVNEPLDNHNPPDGTSDRANYKEALGGNGTTGWDWVINAFKMAREIFPASTKLYINDFNIVNSAANTSTYLKIIRLLQAENLIDGIGVQGHAFSTRGNVTDMVKNLDSLASTGLPIQVTELDIDGPSDEVQLQDYQRIFPAFYEHTGVEGITLWGWKVGLWRNDEGAYLMQQSGEERPALVWLRDYLDSLTLPVVSVEEPGNIASGYRLLNNYPNPFNPSTQISYNLSEGSKVTLDVYDILGRHIQSLVNDYQEQGSYTVRFDASNLTSGVYFYRIIAGKFSETKQMILMR
jgi:endo-1,4-beta-xylanase